MSRPNLRDATPRTHAETCVGESPLSQPRPRVGDVRECPHGKIQVAEQPWRHMPGVRVWRDLSPFWDRRAYRLAKQLLQDATLRPGTSTTTTPEAIDRLETNYGDNE